MEWVTLLLHVLEVQSSNIDPETGYPDFSMAYLSPFKQIPG
jgi:hypothetical protein